MRKKALVISTCLVGASVLFFFGFSVGHRTAQPGFGSRAITPREANLVGNWQMVPEDGEPWKVAFLPNRTALRLNSKGEREIVATWGVVLDELSIQNQHNGDPDTYMPPVTFKVMDGRDGALTLRTLDDAAEWRLVRE